jgi:ATP-dependent helicase HepA
VVSERQKVVVQEQLNRMDEDISAANIFSQQVTKADESAEGQKKMMMEWITKALRFDKVKGEYPDTFRFKYHNDHSDGPRTLMDFKTLVESCVTGIDNDASNHGSIITSMMSADRLEASHGRRVYPFRFGQPFVDAIYEAMKLDSRGICTAVFRQVSVNRVQQSAIFFKLDYLHEGDVGETSYSAQRKADEMLPPYITSQWYKESGELESSEGWISFLNAKDKKQRQMRLIHWEALKEDYSAEVWEKLVDRVVMSSKTAFLNDTALQGYNSRLMAVKVVLVVPV